MSPGGAYIGEARARFHAALLESTLTMDKHGVPSNADRHSRISVGIARGLLEQLGQNAEAVRLAGQVSGAGFERHCAAFLDEVFPKLAHLRPGVFQIEQGKGGRMAAARFDQYEHLSALDDAARENPALAAALGADYLIKPDVVIVRMPESDERINAAGRLVDGTVCRHSSLREANAPRPTLHASVSCKWTIRSDRAQNARAEAVNLVRNRKGRLPHVAVVTGEPTPNRIASIALGTGDIDCVYHFAFPELRAAIEAGAFEESLQMLDIMIEGKRLRDIGDLPLDLAL